MSATKPFASSSRHNKSLRITPKIKCKFAFADYVFAEVMLPTFFTEIKFILTITLSNKLGTKKHHTNEQRSTTSLSLAYRPSNPLQLPSTTPPKKG